MSLFIADAMAAAAPAGPQQGEPFSFIILLVVFGLIFYFMVYRPQSKRVKEHKKLMSSLSKGDEVLTQGGFIGRIVKISEESDFMLIALTENVEVPVQKSAISSVLPKGTMKSI